MPNNPTLTQILKSLQDRTARIQHYRESSQWGYKKAKTNDESNLSYFEAQIAEAIQQIVGDDIYGTQGSLGAIQQLRKAQNERLSAFLESSNDQTNSD